MITWIGQRVHYYKPFRDLGKTDLLCTQSIPHKLMLTSATYTLQFAVPS